jgi:hypothetical protein
VRVSPEYKIKIRKRLRLAYGSKRLYTTKEMYEILYTDALERLRVLAGPSLYKKNQGEIEFRAKGFVNSVIADWEK